MATKPQPTLSIQLRRAPTRYEPTQRIAVGGMAEVWRANALFDDGGEHPVAIKRVLPSIADPLFRSMFLDEARLGMLLRHPNIVRVYDARDIDGTYIMVMELVDGESLRSLTRAAHRDHLSMGVPFAVYIIQEIAKALAYAHRARDAGGQGLGIVHRDVSPQNILLGANGTVKLTDFGLADATVHEHVREDDMVGGKLGYLPPEVIRRESSDHRADLFALGAVFWEMLAGRSLFVGDGDRATIQAIARCEVPALAGTMPSGDDADAIVRKLVTKNPDDRLNDAAILASQLSQLVARSDWKVGPRDVAAAVLQHRAKKSRRTQAPPVTT
ncbi:MAG: serine/threonine protein kinase, partial [Myxococcales bacterium]|nr:serine/threonine protein kinase [Myxococcales bacterium]